ncbi:unnamed protein product [Peronospora belbahrii]|uniref:Uncharacterized protein n=1 Tax=Peronospora belbahrii TaxID=622444 RepID=A0AAU9LBM3_9STRA|nr:unnamed protein product [Peronospora belbahrii]
MDLPEVQAGAQAARVHAMGELSNVKKEVGAQAARVHAMDQLSEVDKKAAVDKSFKKRFSGDVSIYRVAKNIEHWISDVSSYGLELSDAYHGIIDFLTRRFGNKGLRLLLENRQRFSTKDELVFDGLRHAQMYYLGEQPHANPVYALKLLHYNERQENILQAPLFQEWESFCKGAKLDPYTLLMDKMVASNRYDATYRILQDHKSSLWPNDFDRLMEALKKHEGKMSKSRDKESAHVLEDPKNGLAGDDDRPMKSTLPKDNKRKRDSGDGKSAHVLEDPKNGLAPMKSTLLKDNKRKRDSGDGESAHVLEDS